MRLLFLHNHDWSQASQTLLKLKHASQESPLPPVQSVALVCIMFDEVAKDDNVLVDCCRALAAGADLKIFKRLLAAGLSPIEIARGTSPLHLVFGSPAELQRHRLSRGKEEHGKQPASDMQQLIPDVHKIIPVLLSAVKGTGSDLNQVHQIPRCHDRHPGATSD